MCRVVAIIVMSVMNMSILLGTYLEAAGQERALRMIIVRNRKEAQDIRQQLRRGASFSALAYQKSIGPERNQWGYSGVVKLDDVQQKLRPVLQRLQPGQISDVIEIGPRYILVKVISAQIPRYYEKAGRALLAGKTSEALQALQAALKLEKDNVESYIKLAFAYEQTQQYTEAIKSLEKAQRYVPDVAQIAIFRGTIYTNAAIQQKNTAYGQQAVKAYRQAMRLDKRLTPAIHFGLGRLYLLALKQPEKALKYLKKAVKTTPRVPTVYGMLIQAYYDTKRYQQAWEQLRFAQSLGYEFPKLLDALHKVKETSQR